MLVMMFLFLQRSARGVHALRPVYRDHLLCRRLQGPSQGCVSASLCRMCLSTCILTLSCLYLSSLSCCPSFSVSVFVVVVVVVCVCVFIFVSYTHVGCMQYVKWCVPQNTESAGKYPQVTYGCTQNVSLGQDPCLWTTVS